MSSFEDKYKTRHQTYSFIKSIGRMLACVISFILLLYDGPAVALGVFIAGYFFAEILGVMEELI